MPASRKSSSVYHPRYWPHWLLVGVLRGLAFLPLSAQRWLGRNVGRLSYRLLKGRREITRINLSLCFPEKDGAEIEALVRAHFESVGIGFFETLSAWWKPSSTLAPHLRVEGLENLEAARREGGVILLTGHFTTLELAARALCEAGVTFHAMYRRHNDPVFERVMQRVRSKHSGRPALQREQLRPLVRALRQGEAIWYGPDQALPQGMLFVDFFGVPTPTLSATSKLAEYGRAKVVPFYPRREGRDLVVRIAPAWTDFPSDDLEADARRVNAALEDGVRMALPDYFWIHRRFKIRPPGMAPVYPKRK